MDASFVEGWRDEIIERSGENLGRCGVGRVEDEAGYPSQEEGVVGEPGDGRFCREAGGREGMVDGSGSVCGNMGRCGQL